MKQKIFSLITCVMLMLLAIPTTVFADTGPKPSVVISFKGLPDETCYVTLLSKADSTGPYWVLKENMSNKQYNVKDIDSDIWEKFISYKDEDNFYFLQYLEKCDKNNPTFEWGYYPPQEFKILVYLKDSDSFLVSDEVYERYAFDSYYKIKLTESNFKDTYIKAQRDYDYSLEIISLILRIVITILIELLIALLFGYRTKKQILTIAVVNIVTQTILNILLNIVNYKQGQLMFIIIYVLLEIVVFAIEAIVYYRNLSKYSNKPVNKKWLTVVYALVANAVSFAGGLYIAKIIPEIF